MKKNDGFIQLMYGTALGRGVWNVIRKSRIDKVVVAYLRSPLSKPLIPIYIKKNQISMKDFEGQRYGSFRDFFARKRKKNEYDKNPEHLISPCDGLLSVVPIEENRTFCIKGFQYRLSDLTGDKKMAEKFSGGDCLIFRLCASDYHHYCYIDNGYQGKNHYMEGELHSVQPIACEHYPVYKLNRRESTLLETENFGSVMQIEVGAFVVGGIENDHEHYYFSKGREMGHFELCGSTIVLLFEKDRIKLLPEFIEKTEGGREVPVKLGMWIGDKV